MSTSTHLFPASSPPPSLSSSLPSPSLPSSSPSSSSSSSRVSSSVLLSSVWQLLLHFFIPASLANEASHHLPPTPSPPPLTPPPTTLHTPPAPPSPQPHTQLQSCDLILVRTPGVVYDVFRRLAAHSFDHLAIALSHDSVLHVGPPAVRLLPASLLLQSRRQPLVLRPALTEQQRSALVASLTPLIGQPYDTVRVLALIAKLATAQTADKRRERRQRLWRGNRQQHDSSRADNTARSTSLLSSLLLPSSSQSSLICTDAILSRLLAVSPRFRDIVDRWQTLSGTPLDVHTMHSWSINDLHRIAHTTCTPLVAQHDSTFFTTITLPAQQPSTASHPITPSPYSLTSVLSAQRAKAVLGLATSSVLIVLIKRVLVRRIGALRLRLPRLFALLSFTLMYSAFLPSTFRSMAVLLAVLAASRRAAVTKVRRGTGIVAYRWIERPSAMLMKAVARRSRL